MQEAILSQNGYGLLQNLTDQAPHLVQFKRLGGYFIGLLPKLGRKGGPRAPQIPSDCGRKSLDVEIGESATVSYPFFYLSIVLKGSRVETTIGASSAGAGRSVSWVKAAAMGDEEWCAPALDIGIKNLGEGVYEQFIAEWR